MNATPTAPGPRLTLVIAAYDEAPIIADTVRRVVAVAEQRPEVSWELLVVDDGSADGTGELLDGLARAEGRLRVLRHSRNFGQGRAFRTAFAQARGEVVVTLDADLTYSPEIMWRLVDELDARRADMVLASAYMPGGSNANVPPRRLIMSRVANLLLGGMLGGGLRTVTCAVRAYRRAALDELLLESDGMELQYEVVRKALMLGQVLVEIPARLVWPERRKGGARKSKMKVARAIKTCLLHSWLARPSLLFVALGLLLMLPGLYMAAWLVFHFLANLAANLGQGEAANWAVSHALERVFAQYAYSVVISGMLVVSGLVVLFSSLMVLQAKLYYEELYRVGQRTARTLDRALDRLEGGPARPGPDAGGS